MLLLGNVHDTHITRAETMIKSFGFLKRSPLMSRDLLITPKSLREPHNLNTLLRSLEI